MELDNKTIQVLVSGCGKQIQDLVNLKIKESIGISDKLSEQDCCEIKSLYDILEELSDGYNKKLSFQEDIPNLKKRIKYCKDPMKKKMLEKELNGLYKENKRR